MSGCPPRLTFPAYDMGAARIIAGGKHQVGHVLAEFFGWQAWLWETADVRPGNMQEMETVTGRRLGELRRVLRERVELKGPVGTAASGVARSGHWPSRRVAVRPVRSARFCRRHQVTYRVRASITTAVTLRPCSRAISVIWPQRLPSTRTCRIGVSPVFGRGTALPGCCVHGIISALQLFDLFLCTRISYQWYGFRVHINREGAPR